MRRRSVCAGRLKREERDSSETANIKLLMTSRMGISDERLDFLRHTGYACNTVYAMEHIDGEFRYARRELTKASYRVKRTLYHE